MIISDNVERSSDLLAFFEKAGYQAAVIGEKDAALQKESSSHPDAVIFDIHHPNIRGLSLCLTLRKFYKGPLLLMTENKDELYQVLAIELGADDVIIKPYNPNLLQSRTRAFIRSASWRTECKNCNNKLNEFIVDEKRREVFVNGNLVNLTDLEFELLKYLSSQSGKIVSREAIHKALYESSSNEVLARSIDMYICRIRKKLGDSSSNPRYLKTVRGCGYLFLGGKKLPETITGDQIGASAPHAAAV
ncbi:MAG: response regulator transcription factor [Desulfobacteraceae bacterium]|nr:response regulator transcription factor [Desulfobacteraceae bacterium]